jgi:hypothetical protein
MNMEHSNLLKSTKKKNKVDRRIMEGINKFGKEKDGGDEPSYDIL